MALYMLVSVSMNTHPLLDPDPTRQQSGEFTQRFSRDVLLQFAGALMHGLTSAFKHHDGLSYDC